MMSSCVTSHVFEDAQVLGKGNKSIEGSVAHAVYVPKTEVTDELSNFYNGRAIGSTRLEYIKGVSDNIDVGVGIDFPIGIHSKVKWNFAERKLRHLHSAKMDLYLPVRYFFFDVESPPLFAFSPSYIYTYRYDDLLSVSVNAAVMNVLTEDQFAPIPGLAGGIHVGDEIRFTLGVSYFNNFELLDAGRIQYLSVEASIKHDL